jgi:hypothetical protein
MNRSVSDYCAEQARYLTLGVNANETRTRGPSKSYSGMDVAAKEKRQTKEQAEAFANKVKERVPCSGDPYQRIMGWLMPRIAKS